MAKGMLLNPTKTKVLDICTTGKILLDSIVDRASGDIIATVDHARLLGVIFQADMRWTKHIADVTTRASKRLFALLQLRRSGTSSLIMWRVYCAIIRSTLSYAYPAWCNATSSAFSNLVRIERRASKIGVWRADPPIDKFCDGLCKSLMKTVILDSRHPLRELFDTPVQHGRPSTRSSGEFAPPFAKTQRLFNSFIKFAR